MRKVRKNVKWNRIHTCSKIKFYIFDTLTLLIKSKLKPIRNRAKTFCLTFRSWTFSGFLIYPYVSQRITKIVSDFFFSVNKKGFIFYFHHKRYFINFFLTKIFVRLLLKKVFELSIHKVIFSFSFVCTSLFSHHVSNKKGQTLN